MLEGEGGPWVLYPCSMLPIAPSEHTLRSRTIVIVAGLSSLTRLPTHRRSLPGHWWGCEGLQASHLHCGFGNANGQMHAAGAISPLHLPAAVGRGEEAPAADAGG